MGDEIKDPRKVYAKFLVAVVKIQRNIRALSAKRVRQAEEIRHILTKSCAFGESTNSVDDIEKHVKRLYDIRIRSIVMLMDEWKINTDEYFAFLEEEKLRGLCGCRIGENWLKKGQNLLGFTEYQSEQLRRVLLNYKPIELEQYDAALLIEKVARQKQARKKVSLMREQEKQKQESIRIHEEQTQAATKIQGVARQKEAKKVVAAKKEEIEQKRLAEEKQQKDEEEGQAATKIQGVARQKEAKKVVDAKREELRKKAEEEGQAATKIQGVARQKEAKKVVDAKREELRKKAEEEGQAATIIQGVARQKEAKKIVATKREEMEKKRLEEIEKQKVEAEEIIRIEAEKARKERELDPQKAKRNSFRPNKKKQKEKEEAEEEELARMEKEKQQKHEEEKATVGTEKPNFDSPKKSQVELIEDSLGNSMQMTHDFSLKMFAGPGMMDTPETMTVRSEFLSGDHTPSLHSLSESDFGLEARMKRLENLAFGLEMNVRYLTSSLERATRHSLTPNHDSSLGYRNNDAQENSNEWPEFATSPDNNHFEGSTKSEISIQTEEEIKITLSDSLKFPPVRGATPSITGSKLSPIASRSSTPQGDDQEKLKVPHNNNQEDEEGRDEESSSDYIMMNDGVVMEKECGLPSSLFPPAHGAQPRPNNPHHDKYKNYVPPKTLPPSTYTIQDRQQQAREHHYKEHQLLIEQLRAEIEESQSAAAKKKKQDQLRELTTQSSNQYNNNNHHHVEEQYDTRSRNSQGYHEMGHYDAKANTIPHQKGFSGGRDFRDKHNEKYTNYVPPPAVMTYATREERLRAAKLLHDYKASSPPNLKGERADHHHHQPPPEHHYEDEHKQQYQQYPRRNVEQQYEEVVQEEKNRPNHSPGGNNQTHGIPKQKQFVDPYTQRRTKPISNKYADYKPPQPEPTITSKEDRILAAKNLHERKLLIKQSRPNSGERRKKKQEQYHHQVPNTTLLSSTL